MIGIYEAILQLLKQQIPESRFKVKYSIDIVFSLGWAICFMLMIG
jgi:hypothetical protein